MVHLIANENVNYYGIEVEVEFKFRYEQITIEDNSLEFIVKCYNYEFNSMEVENNYDSYILFEFERYMVSNYETIFSELLNDFNSEINKIKKSLRNVRTFFIFI
jgi:hypothetical protein